MPPTSTQTIGESRVVSTQCGERTGESIYTTTDGRQWRTTRLSDHNTTGVTIEHKRG